MAGDRVPATSVSAGRRQRIHLSSSGFGYAGTVARARSAASSPRRTSAWRLVMGVLYEVLLGAAIFALVWPMRHRLRRPGDLAWLVLGLFAAGRFFEFFVRSDSPTSPSDSTTPNGPASPCSALSRWVGPSPHAEHPTAADPPLAGQG